VEFDVTFGMVKMERIFIAMQLVLPCIESTLYYFFHKYFSLVILVFWVIFKQFSKAALNIVRSRVLQNH